MKKLLPFIAILVVALADDFPIELQPQLDGFGVDLSEYGIRVIAEEIKCIREGTNKIVQQDLKSWVDDVEKTCKDLEEHAHKCETHQGRQKQTCLTKLKITAIAEFTRLMKQLPKDLQKMVNEFTTLVNGCLKE